MCVCVAPLLKVKLNENKRYGIVHIRENSCLYTEEHRMPIFIATKMKSSEMQLLCDCLP